MLRVALEATVRRILCILLAFVSGVSRVVLVAATQSGSADVLAADNGTWKAVNSCAPEQWAALVADDVALVTIGGQIFDKAKLRDDFFGTGMHPVPCDTEYTNEPLRTWSYGNSAAVSGVTTLRGNGRGRLRGESRFYYLRLYERRGDTWVWVYGQHTSTKQPPR